MAIFTPEVQVNDGVNVNNFPATQTVTGTVSVGNFPAIQPVSDNGGSLTVDGTVAVSNFPGQSVSTAAVTSVAVNPSTAVTLAASNPARVKLIVHNEAGTLFVKLGTLATTSSYSYRLTANATLELTQYTGDVTAIKLTGTSSALVTEL
jgi:hypothetical protein